MFYLPLENTLSADRVGWAVPLHEPRDTSPNTALIPGTQFQWVYDSVSIGLLKECSRKYAFRMLQGWDWETRPITLSWGTHFHTCIEVFHKLLALGCEEQDAILRCTKLAAYLGETLITNRNERTKETLIRAVIWYLDQFGADDPMKTMVLPNGVPAVELSFMLPIFDIEVGPTDALPALDIAEIQSWWKANHNCYATEYELIEVVQQGRKLFGSITDSAGTVPTPLTRSFSTITIHLAGHIDRVGLFQDEVYINDYKSSGKALDTKWFDSYQPSNQFLLYYTSGQILSTIAKSVFPCPPAGVMLDGVQLGVNFNRFARFPIRYTQSDAEQFLAEFESLVRIKAAGYAAAGIWPGEEGSCNHYSGCEFKCVCTKSPPEWESQLQRNFVQNIWNPSNPR